MTYRFFRSAPGDRQRAVVQVRYDEGVAIHIGPEPCVAVRKGGGEASVGERIGQPLSLVKIHTPVADVLEDRQQQHHFGRCSQPTAAAALGMPSYTAATVCSSART